MFQSPDKVLNELRSGFGGRKIIVVGDLMLDRCLWGQVERISPEAPVPVLKLQRENITADERRRLVIARIRETLPVPGIPLTPSPEELVREDRER